MKFYQRALIGGGLLCVVGYQAFNGQGARQTAAPNAQVERGRYIVEIGGCNDCHTAGYAEAGGK
ncbi:MAG TPA: cytochrome C, partial [Terriglobia bacterium]|nr:cytochrome C [Terriglobia bacterium]